MGKMRHMYEVLAGKYEGKKRSGRPRRRWDCNIEIYVKVVAKVWAVDPGLLGCAVFF
jgi:hypothetical protein